MMTNTYIPLVGGVARSIESFTAQFRSLGHRVLIVAPVFENMPKDEQDVIRLPAIQHFNGSDFSVSLPVTRFLASRLESFKPDIVHSHHPFLIGSTALRIASKYHIPIVFTHHTMWEKYSHYIPGDFSRFKPFIMNLTIGYANLCNMVLAPSESVAVILRKRGVVVPIESVPTGIEVERFAVGNGSYFRQNHKIAGNAFVVGFVGRLAPEKNLVFLSEVISGLMAKDGRVYFLVIGEGPLEDEIRRIFTAKNFSDRLRIAGRVVGSELVDAYHAMDVFAFASRTETQGVVFAEAMAASLPLVAIDAPGAREVITSGVNGFLLKNENKSEFKDALYKLLTLTVEQRNCFSRASKQAAEDFSIQACADRTLDIYHKLITGFTPAYKSDSFLRSAMEQIKTEWDLLVNRAEAAGASLQSEAIDTEFEV